MFRILAVFLIALTGKLCSGALYFESGDAGRTLGNAQSASGAGVLQAILGNLEDNFDVDLYRVWITDPAAFSAATVDAPGITVSDPQLFLFDPLGRAVYMNDDDPSGTNGSQSLLAPGHPFGPLMVGIYFLGIGWFDNEPFSATGMMFDPTGAPGPRGAAALAGWDDNVSARPDRDTLYVIELSGTTLIPEPGTWLLTTAGVAGLFVCARRRSA